VLCQVRPDIRGQDEGHQVLRPRCLHVGEGARTEAAVPGKEGVIEPVTYDPRNDFTCKHCGEQDNGNWRRALCASCADEQDEREAEARADARREHQEHQAEERWLRNEP